MKSKLTSLICHYDAFGWIPTIRGALSLDLLGAKNRIWGQVDKYAVAFKEFNGLSSERYVAATSYQIVSDSKFGKDITRTFRYFFYGSIHSKEDGEKLIQSIDFASEEQRTQTEELIDKDGVLIGRLIIRNEQPPSVSSKACGIILKISELIKKRDEYNYKFNIEAASFDVLTLLRKEMLTQWKVVKEEMNQLSGEGIRQYEFEVLLTRDGLILLKDCTAEEYKNDYFESGTPSDYTSNVYIHRIFKNAMNFIKYLFHSNYHHEEDNDTFLPASNLHPFRKSTKKDFSRIFKHQLDSFLNPIILMRQSNFKNYFVDANGICNYARAFVYACRNNRLISSDFSSCQLDYINLLDSEVNHASRHNKSLLSSIATQRNLFFIITTVLAFAVASLKIFESAISLSGNDGGLLADKPWYATVIVLFSLGLLGYVLFEVSYWQITKKEFHKNSFKNILEKFKKFVFFRNSNYKKRRLSYSLQSFLKLQNLSHNPINVCLGWLKKNQKKSNNVNSTFLTEKKVIAFIGSIVWCTIAYILIRYIKIVLRGLL